MKKQFLIGLAVGMMMFGAVGMASATPIQWTVADGGNDHWYESVPSIVTWDTANANAQASTHNGITGHLATITTAQENSYILSIINSSSAWLGGFQPAGSPEPDGNWQWVTGETWNYSNWNIGEPNNSAASVLGPENSLIVYAPSGVWNDGHWWISEQGYIVEYDTTPVPEPATILLVGTGLAGLIGARRKKKKIVN